jgi:hypothetical protein
LPLKHPSVIALLFLFLPFSTLFGQTEGTPQGMAPGPYTIHPSSNSSACIDLNGASSANGAVIQSYACNGANSQSWQLIPSGTAGSYAVVSSASGSCADVSGVSTAAGALVHQWQCLGPNQLNQIWQFIPFGAGYELVSVNSGMCLDLPYGNSGNGNQLQQYSCGQGGNPNQLWIMTPIATSAQRATTASVGTLTGEPAAQADSFVDSVGVATHLAYVNTAYAQWPTVLGKIQAMGVRHLRDGFSNWPSWAPYFGEHQTLAGLGIKTTYVVPLDLTTTPQILESFASQVTDMEAIEPPNECDAIPNCGGGGLLGVSNVVSFLPTLQAAGQNINVPVLGPAFTVAESYVAAGNIASQISYNNLHVYFGGRNPGTVGWGGGDAQGNSYGSFAWWMDQANVDAPNVPDIITESGYLAFPQTVTPYTIPESVEASYTPRTFLLAFNHGIKRTYAYELVDEITSLGYGLLRSDLSEKPAFTAVKNLMSTLSDPGANFSPGKLAYLVGGADSTLAHTLLQKRDGSFWLVLWLERSSYDEATNTPTPVTPQNITLQVSGGATVKQLVQFDSFGNSSTVDVSGSGATLPLAVSDQISIVKVAAP